MSADHRWYVKRIKRYRCDRCRRWFSRTVWELPGVNDLDKYSAHFCGRKNCYAPGSPGLFDGIQPPQIEDEIPP